MLARSSDTLRDLVGLAASAVAAGTAERDGPLPSGGPAAVAAAHAALGPVLPEHGHGGPAALAALAAAFAAGSVEPGHPFTAAHLHGPPLAVAAAADLVISALNQSMDSWDQAPVAGEFERAVSAELAALAFPTAPAPDALITSGGTESNQLGLLLAREAAGPVTPVCGRTAHHSVARAAWLLGLPAPVEVAAPDERMQPAALAAALAELAGPAVVVATAGTTDTGRIDPLPELAAVAREHGARLHVDAAYGGAALFSPVLAPRLRGLAAADSVALDLHKFGWQPIASGVLVVADAADLGPLGVRADYLNAEDDTAAGLPDRLDRSLRTSRRADAFRIAVTLRALGRDGLAALVEHCCATAVGLAAAVRAHPELRLWAEPDLSTLLLRPRLAADSPAGDRLVAEVRRTLLHTGRAVVGRAAVDGRLWWKLTLLNPEAGAADYLPLLELLARTAAECR
jgi:L-2,4-diaminobutyrate decarboxylase